MKVIILTKKRKIRCEEKREKKMSTQSIITSIYIYMCVYV